MIAPVRRFFRLLTPAPPRRFRVMKRRPCTALFSFGVVADIQYGDKETKASSSRPESLMQYRKGIARLNTAIKEMASRKETLKFVLNLGDIIDGNENDDKTLEDLHAVLDAMQQLENGASLEVCHVIGNHCLRVPHALLRENLKMTDLYYARTLHVGWKLIVLNSNDIGVHAEGDDERQDTEEFLQECPMDSSPNIKTWNGGITTKQLKWLKSELASAKDSNQRVIIGCHHPFGTNSARATHMAWNASQIETAVVESGVVALVLTGHDHVGGYSHINSTHFLTLHGIVEAQDGDDPFALIHVSDHEICIEGHGSEPSRRLALNSL